MTRSANRRRTFGGRHFALLCALLLAVFVSELDARTFRLPFSTASQTPHPAVTRIRVAEDGATSHGTGTLVNVAGQHGLVVTNWHVIRDAAGDIQVEFPDGFRSAARILKVDHNWDLAALQIWRPAVEPVPLSATAPQPGDRLSIAGYGSGQYRSVFGRCTQYVAPGANFPYEMVELSAEARQGDSGGPIFNERSELAGVLFGASRGTTSGSYCGRVRVFLSSVLDGVGSDANQVATGLNGAGHDPYQFGGVVPPQGTRTVIEGRTAESGGAPYGATHAAPFNMQPLPPAPLQPTANGPFAGIESNFGTSPRLTPSVDLSPTYDPGAVTAPVYRDGSPLGSAWSNINDDQPLLSSNTKRETAPWEDLVGQTPFEQGKSVLAGIGILALLLRLSNVLAGGRD